MTLQPWRIYNPSFRYRHSVYEGLNAHVLARDDGRDQPPGGLPPGPQAALPLIMHEMTHLRCQSQFPWSSNKEREQGAELAPIQSLAPSESNKERANQGHQLLALDNPGGGM